MTMRQRATLGPIVVLQEGQPPSDQAVVAAILNGREWGWRELWGRYNNTINRRIRSVIGNCSRLYRSSELFADIRAEFHLALLNNDMARLRAFDPAKGKLAGWLSMIAHQTAVTYLAKEVRRGVPLPIESLGEDEAGERGDENDGDGQRGARWIARGL